MRPVAAQPATDPRDARILRVEQWLKAALRHTPGEADEAAALVGSWTDGELRALWTDGSALATLMRKTTLTRIFVKPEFTDGRGDRVRYTQAQLQRLRVLACVASGRATWAEAIPAILVDPVCAVAPAMIDPDLRELASRADASGRRGDPNFFIRRAAMLHADVAVSPPMVREHADVTAHGNGEGESGPQQLRVHILDGRGTRFQQAPLHWMIGRMLLSEVRPAGSRGPAPAADDMVRRWYRASIAWMQLHEDYDTTHVTRALWLFPDDPDLLFLVGCLNEAFAAPRIQTAIGNTSFPDGLGLNIVSGPEELARAEMRFRAVLAVRPDAVEARLRLGHVLLELGRYRDAAVELRRAVPRVVSDQELRYDGELFLGAAEEGTRNFGAAREAFERAAALYPSAQTPWIALSQLAQRGGDRDGALRAIDRLFALPPADARLDPRSIYQIAQARNADSLLDGVRRLVSAGIAP